MLQRIVEKIQDKGERYVRERKPRIKGGSIGALGFSAGLQFTEDVRESKSFPYKLSRLCDGLAEKGKGILILVDEVRASSPEVRQLVIGYQELVGEGKNVALVMAGLPSAISATLNDSVLTFLNRAYKVSLDPLSHAEVDAFYAQAFSQLGIRISDDLRRRAARATQGSPYLLQLVGHNVALYSQGHGEVGEAMLQSAITSAREDFLTDICQASVKQLSRKDVEFLQAMAADEGPSRMADIAARMGVTADYAQAHRKRLIDAGIVAPQGRGWLVYAIPYMGDHLRSEQAF